jgi:hypothetical protein
VLLAVAALTVVAASVAVELDTVAGDLAASTELACVVEAALSDVVAALLVAECFEFDSVLAGVGVGSLVSGAGVAGGALG